MKWLAAGVTFVNVATVWALLSGLMARGLSTYIAAFSILIALVAAAFAYAGTRDPRANAVDPAGEAGETPKRHGYDRIWFYLLAFCFAFFAFRGFCWILFLDANNWKVQSPNNLGDLALHITYINTFASGVPLWPENPIHFLSNLRYPAGVDLFNSLLLLLGVELANGFIWVGLVASVATFYALYRWGGAFGIAGFLFNGGVAGFAVLQTWSFIDYQGVPTIAWKSLPLSMFITQRGFLWALPAGLLLLYQWRTKYFPAPPPAPATDDDKRGPLPFWLEIAIYGSMPFFHVHTFMALSIVAAFLFAIGDAATRKQLALMAAIAFIPATFFVWTITDHFQARSLIEWQPGWVQNSGEFAAPAFHLTFKDFGVLNPLIRLVNAGVRAVIFWFINFGVFIPIVAALIATCIWRVAQSQERFRWRDHPSLAFLTPAVLIFLFACLVKTAPWEWDNIKLIIWAYLLILPFLWSELIAHWSVPVRAAVCIALFFSGFVSLYGGLVGKENGYGIADRAELDAVGAVVQRLPKDARFATFPTYNHPVLLQGRKVVLGYPGHLWTQGFDYTPAETKLKAVMNGEAGWKEHARELRARYLFWGREEKANDPASQRTWEREARLVASGAWGAIYDLAAPPLTAPQLEQ